jgi:hypothetical protein
MNSDLAGSCAVGGRKVCAATRVNLPKCQEKRQRRNAAMCRHFASSRTLRQTIRPPLHGGGQGFESPRLHSENQMICR